MVLESNSAGNNTDVIYIYIYIYYNSLLLCSYENNDGCVIFPKNSHSWLMQWNNTSSFIACGLWIEEDIAFVDG